MNDLIWQGYARKHGKPGIRNRVLVLYTVKCAEFVAQQIVLQAAHPVLWEDCVAAMREFGADAFIEAGPGKTLGGFNKRIDRKIKNMNVEDAASLEKTLDTWKEVR